MNQHWAPQINVWTPQIKVWAPQAQQIELLIDGQSYIMQSTKHGWWLSHRTLEHGEEYQFAIDGKVFPDPRSQWQPHGVHGPSRFVDHRLFEWTDRHWQQKPWPSAIVYELHIGTFTPEGTFASAIAKLDHLVALGITHVELLPVAEFLGEYGWGYDGVYPYAAHHAYGGPEGLKQFVNACHEHGLAVILDVVYNHLGPSGNYLPQYGPYFLETRTTPWGTSLNFDGPLSDEVRRFFIDNALMWLTDYHIDGLRLDAVHAIVDHSAVHLLEELATSVEELSARLGRHFVLIAESDLNDPRIVRSAELGGFGLDAQWSDDIHHALHSVLTGEREGYYADFGSLTDLATALTRPYVYAGRYSEHRKRRHGRPPTSLPAHRFVAYLQNHDQLGNRACGERLCHLVNTDRAKIGAALVLLSPYIPLLFQGEEWAATAPFQYFVDFQSEPDLGQAVSIGRTQEFASFGWNPADVPNPTNIETFRRSQLNWDELDQPEHQEMLAWHQQLIQLRRRVASFTVARLDEVHTEHSEAEQWLRVRRGNTTILCNFAADAHCFPLANGEENVLLLSSKPLEQRTSQHAILAGESVAVFGPAEVAVDSA